MSRCNLAFSQGQGKFFAVAGRGHGQNAYIIQYHIRSLLRVGRMDPLASKKKDVALPRKKYGSIEDITEF